MKSFKQFVANKKIEPDKKEEPFEMPSKKVELEPLSDDLTPLKELEKQKKIRLKDDKWELVSIVDVSTKAPDISEAVIVNADLGNSEMSRGDVIYITAMLRKKDAQYYSQNVMGVLKCRVVDIYNSLSVLNGLK